MGNHPSSYFGFGVAFDGKAIKRDDTPGSPWQMLCDGEPQDGLAVVDAGYDASIVLLVIHESLSVSDDWSPKAITPTEMAVQPEWADKINAYLDRWGLRGKTDKGFESPAFLHAPRYG